MPRTKPAVFISHISDEAKLAQWLKTQLDRDFLGGLSLFVSSDRSTIGAGRPWLDEVRQALKSADLQIVLCSHASVGRPWVNFEAGAAWLRDIAVVPACHSGLEPESLPVPLNMLESIVLTSPDGLAKLYDAVANALGLRTPAVDFAAIAAEARELESTSGAHAKGLEIVQNPRVLCAATEQYAQAAFGFDLDVAVVERHFPGRVHVERTLTAGRLRNLLLTDQFDIVHLVLAVDPESGALIFSTIDTVEHRPVGRAETMSSSAFAALLVEAHTRLVVLATCKALLLAVEVATVANMAASDQDIYGQDAADWADCFYRLIAQGKSVYRAFDLTRQMDQTPIRAVRQKDVVFAIPP